MMIEDARHDIADMRREQCKHEDHELTEAGSAWCPSCRREFSTVNGAILYDEDEENGR